MKKQILLVDGNGLLFRAHYSNINKPLLTTKNGIPTSAVYSFAHMLFNFMKVNNYYSVFVAFDKGKKTFRHQKLTDYKAGRKSTPSELVQQFAIVREFLTEANIEWDEIDLYEADDIIGSIAKKYKNNEEYEIHILSSDQDMYQLIDNNIFVLSPQVGTSDLKKIDKESLYEKLNLTPEQIIDYKGLRGDNSDNIKGVAGVGEKIAVKLLIEYKTLENIYNHVNDIKGSLKEKLINGRDDAFLSKEIATIFCDLDTSNIKLNQINIKFDQLKTFFEKYEMKSLIKKFILTDINDDEEDNSKEIEYITLDKWELKYSDKVNYIYLETLNDNYHRSQVIGISILNSKGIFYYTFNNSSQTDIFNWQEQKIDKDFEEFLLKNEFKTYDIKKTLYVLNDNGYKVNENNFTYDMMLACYILNSNVKSNFLNHLNYLDPSIEIQSMDEIFGKGVKRTTLIDKKLKELYLINKVIYIKEFEKQIIETLEKNDQLNLYEKIELPLAKLLFNSEKIGVLIDKEELKLQEKDLEIKLISLEKEIKNLVEEHIEDDFNIASPKQLKELLFEKLKLKDYKKGSTDKEVLELLLDEHPVIEKLLIFRKFQKLYTTYLKGMNKFIDADNRIRTIFNQTLTNTGRLSSSDPNLQNISIRDEDQKQVRKIFISEQGYTYLGYDYSQIELRILADVADEKELISTFENNLDIHTEAAKKIFNLVDQNISSEQRRVAKVFNFGILYGLSDFGLARDLKISVKEAKNYIEEYYHSFPGILNYKQDILDFAYKNYFVKTIGNRRRYLPELQTSQYFLKQFGERAAINAPIQGTAADVIKVAMIKIYEQLKEQKKDANIVAQIHDEIILQVKNSEIELVNKIVIKNMKEAFEELLKITNINRKPRVKLEISNSQGINWYELK